MNKQELIDEIKRIHASAIGRSHVSTHPLYSDGVADTCSDVIKLLEQLDEPQKPVVPKFVADWFEEHKDDLEWSIWKLTIDSNTNYTKDKKEMRHWIQHAPNKPYRTLIAMLDGYDVEKEPLYCVKMPFRVWDEESAELKTEFLYLGYDITSDETMFFPTSESRKVFEKDFKTKLDEATIKSADEKYWAFAVQVDEVEG